MPKFAHALVKANKFLAHHLPEAQVMKSLADGTHAEILRAHLGDAYDDFAAAVKSLASKKPGKKGRRVFILPGITGSLLGVPQGEQNHVKWLDPQEVAEGNLLKLAYSEKTLLGTSVGAIVPVYLPLKLRLQLAGHEVELLHYDWRLRVEELGPKLAAQIKADKSDKITLVCHSMGGLVARAALKDSAASKKVEMVVQMGTPNLGAPCAPQGVRGSYPPILQVASLDLKHTVYDYGGLLNSLPGFFCLIPPKGSPFGLDVRDRSVWPKSGNQPNDNLLANVGFKQDGLVTPDSRFHLVAGGNLETVLSVKKRGDEFLYEYGYAGDGIVPWTSSAIPGIKDVWYADGVSHTNLCAEPSSVDAAAAILEGKSPSLPNSLKVKKTGITSSQTDASLIKAFVPLAIEGDARHLFDAAYGLASNVESKVEGTAHSLESSLKKAGSFLKKFL